jgi:hypothetical protein
VAKNRNQNRQREQRDQRPDRGAEAQEPMRSGMDEEHGMPSSTQAPRGRQQKRFGHN